MGMQQCFILTVSKSFIREVMCYVCGLQLSK